MISAFLQHVEPANAFVYEKHTLHRYLNWVVSVRHVGQPKNVE